MLWLMFLSGNDGRIYVTSRHGVPGDRYSGCEWIFHFGGESGLWLLRRLSVIDVASTYTSCTSSTTQFTKFYIK